MATHHEFSADLTAALRSHDALAAAGSDLPSFERGEVETVAEDRADVES